MDNIRIGGFLPLGFHTLHASRYPRTGTSSIKISRSRWELQSTGAESPAETSVPHWKLWRTNERGRSDTCGTSTRRSTEEEGGVRGYESLLRRRYIILLLAHFPPQNIQNTRL